MTPQKEIALRNLCEYLGFDVQGLPIGEFGPRYVEDYGFGLTRFRRDALVEAEPGTVCEALALALTPRHKAPGEIVFDGRLGTQGCIESLLLQWPSVPPYSDDWYMALRGRIWLEQGAGCWEYVDPNPRAVYAALCAGESAESVRRRLRAGDPLLVQDHRAARNGDRVQPVT